MRVLKIKQVIDKTGLSRSTIYALIARLCDLSHYLPELRDAMHEAQRRTAPGNVSGELDIEREPVREAEDPGARQP